MAESPDKITIRVQFSKNVNEEVEFDKVASNSYGTVYVNMEHQKFHIIGNKVKCLVVLSKDMVASEHRIAAIALFAMLNAFDEA